MHDHLILDEFDYGCNWNRMAVVICSSIRKIAIFDFVYTLASTIIKQSAPNLVKVYMTIRSRMSLISGVIRPEQLKLFTLKFEKLLYLTVYTSIYKYQPISPKRGQNIYDS